MSNINDYITGNLLDFACFKKNYRLIAINLSKQTKLKDPKQINFVGKLEKDDGTTMFLSSKNQRKLLLIFQKILLQSNK